MISIKLLCNFIEITLRHEYSPVNLLHIFRTPFPQSNSLRCWVASTCLNTRLFFSKQHFYMQCQAETDKKFKGMLSYILSLSYCYLKIIHILHIRYHPKILRCILKMNKFVCIHEIT